MVFAGGRGLPMIASSGFTDLGRHVCGVKRKTGEMAQQTITLDQFRVDLAQLKEAQDQITVLTIEIQSKVLELDACITDVGLSWGAPAEATLPAVQRIFSVQMGTLVDLLVEMTTRMGTAYDNYRTAEESGATSFTLG